MLDKNCNFLTSITISLIIAFAFTILFYTGIITGITTMFIFALGFSLLSLLLTGLFGISDNGLTRNRLCQNITSLIVSVIGNILFCLLALIIPLSTGAISSTILVAISSFFFVLNLITLIETLFSIIRYN